MCQQQSESFCLCAFTKVLLFFKRASADSRTIPIAVETNLLKILVLNSNIKQVQHHFLMWGFIKRFLNRSINEFFFLFERPMSVEYNIGQISASASRSSMNPSSPLFNFGARIRLNLSDGLSYIDFKGVGWFRLIDRLTDI